MLGSVRTGDFARTGRLGVGYACSVAAAVLLISFFPGAAQSATLQEAQALYRRGEYQQCLTTVSKEIEDGQWSDAWRVLKIEAELALGRYDEAKLSVEAALKRYTTDLKLRWLAFITYRLHNDDKLAQEKLHELELLARDRPARYSDTMSRVVLGRYFLHRNADPRQVLELFYDKAKKSDAKSPEAYIASGELALAKEDFQLAAQEFRQAVKLDAQRADAHFGLARALADSDSEAAGAAIAKTLELNPRYTDALILVAERHIDSEQYGEAKKTIAVVHRVNPHHSAGWALLAVIAHLDADFEAQKKHRRRALKYRSKNPEVDHRIGRKLSRKYRFKEGAAHQRAALAMQADFLPAKLQLCQDLLRLGQEEEGWRLAAEVNKQDGYSVVAHNLVSLHDEIQKFTTLKADGFWVRMDSREAKIYGDDVLALLSEARNQLVEKYDVKLQEPVIVEIFPRQADFAIRTFGLPGGVGFLGVCFGRVITANSPASQTASPTNWQAVLWHEYCHVVTLQKTSNRMPRWLSEGISVYEERQRNPAWGQAMSASYREMILGDDLTPVSELSGAFLRPPSPVHLQFAYYQSSLVVEFLVEKYGFATLLRVLDDLNVGMPINESLARYAGGIEQVDKGFVEFATAKAKQLAPKLDFEKPDEPLSNAEQVVDWNTSHPNNYWGQVALAHGLMQAEEWEEARKTLLELKQRFPSDRSATSPVRLLAQVERKRNDTASELVALRDWCDLSNDDLDAFQRMIALSIEEKDWKAADGYVRKCQAVNPLREDIQRRRAMVAEQLKDRQTAIQALKSLFVLEPVDPADVSYRLAVLLEQEGRIDDAKRRALHALEEAPRYLDAHRLLRRLQASKENASAKANTTKDNTKPKSATEAEARSPAAKTGKTLGKPAKKPAEGTSAAKKRPRGKPAAERPTNSEVNEKADARADPNATPSQSPAQPPVDKPPVDKPPVDKPPVDKPPVDKPPVDDRAKIDAPGVQP